MIRVRDKFTNKVYQELEETPVDAVRSMLDQAIRASKTMRKMPAHERSRILESTSEAVLKNARMLAETIAIEAGKPMKYSLKEARRASVTMKFSGEEAKRIYGETVPFDAEPRGEGAFAYYVREPVGTVLAITPFNDPLNLVAHKLGPAIAAGNAIIVKPSMLTPLSAIHLVDLLRSSGLPDACAQVLLAPGASPQVQDLLREERIKVVSLTGGPDAAAEVIQRGGIKEYSMELGSNCPVIVWADADVDRAVPEIVDGGFECQGQNCIHVQRVLIHESIYDEAKARILEGTKRLRVGNPLSEDTDVGPMISEEEARRVEEWVDVAVEDGAKLLAGGQRQGSVYQPTVLEGADPRSDIAQKEIFGPVTLLFKVSSLDEAIRLSNDVPYGLQAGVFTKSIDVAQKCADGLEYGGVLVNRTSDFRVDFMPFGGYKRSGLGREGIRFAIEEMTQIKLVVYQKAG
jgi:glyceraldehyde-3-phosphate dehydrogenase (NADP+)